MSTTQNAKLKVQNNNAKRKTACFKLLVIALSFALYAFSFNKSAAADLSLSISPTIIEIQVDSPDIINEPIAIKNHSNQTAILNIQLKPFKADNKENGEVLYFSGKDPLIFNNIKIVEDNKTVEKVVISPNQTKNLNLQIDIPHDEILSDYYFSVIFVSENTDEERLNYLKIQGGIALNVLLSIKGDLPLFGAKPTSIGKIIEFSTPSFLEKGPVIFTVRLKNQSNHFIKPQGTILIKNIFGKTIGQVKIQSLNILANTTRMQKSMLKDDLLFGLYNANLSISFSDNGEKITRNVLFLVFPVKILIGLAILVFIIVIVQKRIKTRRRI